MNPTLGLTRLPPEILDKLQAMSRRVNRILWIRGLLVTTAVALLSALLVMAADATIVLLHPSARWLLTGLAVAAVLAAAWYAIALPLRNRMTPRRMARVLETRYPEMQERITSAIELLGQGGDAAAQGSAQLLALLAQGALSDVRGVKARREFAGRTARPALAAAALAAAVLAVLFAVWPTQTRLLLARAVAPNLELPNLQAIALRVEPGSVACLRGEPLTLRLRAPGDTVDPAELRILRPGVRTETVERMAKRSSGPDGVVYELTLPAVEGPFSYRMVCGRGVTRSFSVSIVDPPAVETCSVRLEPPAYTRRPALDLPSGLSDIDGIAGTRVGIEASFSEACDARLVIGDIVLPPLETAGDGSGGTVSARWSFVLGAHHAGPWGVSLRNAAGHTNRADRARIRVEGDAAPVVTLVEPRTPELRLPPHGAIPLAYEVVEDIGLASANLNLRFEPSGRIQRSPLPLEPSPGGPLRGTTGIDLASMDLSGVSMLRLWITALDNLPRELGGPQSATSREVAVILDRQAERLEAQRHRQSLDTLRASFADAAAKLESAAARTDAIRPRLANPDDADSALEDLRAGPLREALRAEREMRRAVAALDDLPKPAADALKNAVETTVPPARQALEEVLLAPDAQREKLAGQAAEALREAAAKTREWMERAETYGEMQSQAYRIDDLAHRQRKAAADLERAPDDPLARQAFEEAQRELAEELPKLATPDAESRKEALGQLADDLRQQATSLRGQAEEQRANTELSRRLAQEATREQAADEIRERSAQARAGDAKKAEEAVKELSVPAGTIARAAEQAEEAARLALEAARRQEEGAARKARDAFEKALRAAEASAQAAREAVAGAEAAAERAGRNSVPHAREVAEAVAEAAAQVEEAARHTAEARRLADEAAAKPAAERLPYLEAATERAREAARVARLAAEAAERARKELEPVGDTYELLYAEMGSESLEIARAAAQAAAMARQAAEMAAEAAKLPQENPEAALEAARALREQAAEAASQARAADDAARQFAERADALHAAEAGSQTEPARQAAEAALAAADQARHVANLLDPPTPDYSNLAQEEFTRQLDAASQAAASQAGQAEDRADSALDAARQMAGSPPEPTPEQRLGSLQDRLQDIAEEARRDLAATEIAARALDNSQSHPSTAQDMLWHAMQDAQAAMEQLEADNPGEAAARQQLSAEHFEAAAAQMEQMADRLDAATPADPADSMPGESLLGTEDVLDIASGMADVEQALRDLREQGQASSPEERRERAEVASARTAGDAAALAAEAAETAAAAAGQAEEMFDRLAEARETEAAVQPAVQAAQAAAEAARAVAEAARAQASAQAEEHAAETHAAAEENAAAAEAVQQAAGKLIELARQIGGQAEQALQAQEENVAEAVQALADLAPDAAEVGGQAVQAVEAARQADAAAEATGDGALDAAANQTAQAAEAALQAAEKAAEAMDRARQAAGAEAPAERVGRLQEAAELADEARELAEQAAGESEQARTRAAAAEEAARMAREAAGQAILPAGQAESLYEAAQAAVEAARDAVTVAEASPPEQADADASRDPASEALDMARQAAAFAEEAAQRLAAARDAAAKAEASPDDPGAQRASALQARQAIETSAMAENLAREAESMAKQAAENAWQETQRLAQAAAEEAARSAETARHAETAADQAATAARQDGATPSEEAREMLAQAKQAATLAKEAAGQVQGALPDNPSAVRGLDEAERRQGREQAKQAGETARQAEQLAGKAVETAQRLQAHADEASGKAAKRAADAARKNAGRLNEAAQGAARQALDGMETPPQEAGDASQGKDEDDPSQGGKAGNKPVAAEEIELELETFIHGFPASEWAKIKGMRGSAALEEILARVPADYRELVRRYFLVLSEEAVREELEAGQGTPTP
jgi:hypothetical protein